MSRIRGWIKSKNNEMKDLCAANGALTEKLSNLLKDRDLQIKEVRKFLRD